MDTDMDWAALNTGNPRFEMFFDATREQFDLPDGVIYLDGNSLGPLTHASKARVAEVVEAQWGTQLINAWNESAWIDLPLSVGDRIGALIGAEESSVYACDSTSINLFKVLSSALEMREPRRVVLSDSGNFPTDLYIAQGLLRRLGDYELRIVDPEDVAEAITDEVAVVMLTQVDYRTGRLHDMETLTALAHEAGALSIWDLAHSAGALPIDLLGAEVDFAIGCGYKYLNGGPGAPSFVYVAPVHADAVAPVLSGWLGHEAPFAFEREYRPAPGAARMVVGTPSILALASLDAALDVWDMTSLVDVRTRSIELSQRFIAAVESRCPELDLASPRDPAHRGSQVSFRFEHGYAAMQAMIDRGVIGDFRAPDLMRFGITPLYLSGADIDRAVDVLAEVVGERLWDVPEYQRRSKVT